MKKLDIICHGDPEKLKGLVRGLASLLPHCRSDGKGQSSLSPHLPGSHAERVHRSEISERSRSAGLLERHLFLAEPEKFARLHAERFRKTAHYKRRCQMRALGSSSSRALPAESWKPFCQNEPPMFLFLSPSLFTHSTGLK